MATSLAIGATGMVTGVGLDAPSSCAAIRCAIDNFQETRFLDRAGEWIMGCEVSLEQPWRGRHKLLQMAAMAVREALAACPDFNAEQTPLLLCLPELSRPGRVMDEDNQLFLELQVELGLEFHDHSRIIASGHVATALALRHAHNLIHQQGHPRVLVAATDSYLVRPTLAHFERQERLLTSLNSNGFIPGEAGVALILESPGRVPGERLCCRGLGFGVESAHVESEQPLRADGLSTAIKDAVRDAGFEMGDLDFRITDLSGEQYYFKEASLALSRTLRTRKEEFDIWHPADCIGEVGAAAGAAMLVVLKSACDKGYSLGTRILAHAGNDDGKRASWVLAWMSGG
ncbi:MAG: hypothetical protein ABW076_15785 [Candidatus Thiodiazotropha sp.]